MTEPITWTNETRKLSDLIPWDLNPKQLTVTQAKQLEVSLRKFGFAIPLLISPDNDIYDGNQRQALMSLMGEYGPDAMIDVRVSSRLLTFDEQRELVVRIKENQADWDWETLGNRWEVSELIEWGMSEWQLRLDSFSPNELPEYSTNVVKDEDIVTAEKKLSGKFSEHGHEEYEEVACPHCGELFYLKP